MYQRHIFKIELARLLNMACCLFGTSTYVSILWSTKIQLSAVIMQSNITTYCIHHCRNWGRISIRGWTHTRHPIPHPNGQAMGCLLWILFERNDRVITALHCIWLFHIRIALAKCSAFFSVLLYRIPNRLFLNFANTGLILGLHPANERRRYKVTPSLIGCAQT